MTKSNFCRAWGYLTNDGLKLTTNESTAKYWRAVALEQGWGNCVVEFTLTARDEKGRQTILKDRRDRRWGRQRQRKGGTCD